MCQPKTYLLSSCFMCSIPTKCSLNIMNSQSVFLLIQIFLIVSQKWYSGFLEVREVLVNLLDISLFSHVRFLLFALSNFFLFTWVIVPYIYLNDYAIETGFSDSEASYLISIIGIFHMIGMVSIS